MIMVKQVQPQTQFHIKHLPLLYSNSPLTVARTLKFKSEDVSLLGSTYSTTLNRRDYSNTFTVGGLPHISPSGYLLFSSSPPFFQIRV